MSTYRLTASVQRDGMTMDVIEAEILGLGYQRTYTSLEAASDALDDLLEWAHNEGSHLLHDEGVLVAAVVDEQGRLIHEGVTQLDTGPETITDADEVE